MIDLSIDSCLLCAGTALAGSARGLCRPCEHCLPWQPPGCNTCALLLGHEGDSSHYCAACLQDPPLFDTCHVLFEYCPPVQDLIASFKYQSRLAAGQTLAMLLARSFGRHYGQNRPQLLLPVPLHPWRLRQRGFNQSVVLVQAISRLHQIDAALHSCRRLKPTAAQRGLNVAQRALNLRGMFTMSPGIALPRHVAIIDDVVTTKATVNEMARALRGAGACRIDVWALARAN